MFLFSLSFNFIIILTSLKKLNKIQTLKTTMVKYTRNIGKKFQEDGQVRHFPGNTIICHIPKESAQFQFLTEFQKQLQKQSWAHHFSFLPKSSYHMTVFEGICDQVRKSSHWFKSLPIETPLLETDEYLRKIWSEIDIPEGFHMKATHLSIGNVITLRLKPIDIKMNEKIRKFRDLLSEKTTLRQPNHAIYGFHISFAYKITKESFLEKLQIQRYVKQQKTYIQEHFHTLQTNPPELTYFEDMFEFAHQRN